MEPAARWFARLTGVGIAGSFAIAAVAITRPWAPARLWGYHTGVTIYPWWTWALLALAVVVAVAGFVAAGLALWQLLADHAFRRPTSSVTAVLTVTVGIGIVALLPVVMLDPADTSVLTTWGAVGLIYAGPWGITVAASARLTRPAALAALGAVTGGAVLAALGPQMTDLLLADDGRFVVVVVAIAALAAASRARRAQLP